MKKFSKDLREHASKIIDYEKKKMKKYITINKKYVTYVKKNLVIMRKRIIK